MQYNFNIINDKMVCDKRDTPLTGNVNTYRCVFNIKADIENLLWFCVFEREGRAYVQPILDAECFIPHEVLVREGSIKIGCYATNLKQDDYKRISTNWVYFTSLEGAYTDASVPEVPEPDVWEELVLKSVPIIGENGNWFTYDMVSGEYVDTGISVAGSDVDLSNYYTKGEIDNFRIQDEMNMERHVGVRIGEVSEEAEATFVKKTDYADNSSNYGLVRPAWGYGTYVSADGYLTIVSCTEGDIDARVNATRPITPAYLEYAVTTVGNEYYAAKGQVGDIESALDAILAIQNELIGG